MVVYNYRKLLQSQHVTVYTYIVKNVNVSR